MEHQNTSPARTGHRRADHRGSEGVLGEPVRREGLDLVRSGQPDAGADGRGPAPPGGPWTWAAARAATRSGSPSGAGRSPASTCPTRPIARATRAAADRGLPADRIRLHRRGSGDLAHRRALRPGARPASCSRRWTSPGRRCCAAAARPGGAGRPSADRGPRRGAAVVRAGRRAHHRLPDPGRGSGGPGPRGRLGRADRRGAHAAGHRHPTGRSRSWTTRWSSSGAAELPPTSPRAHGT